MERVNKRGEVTGFVSGTDLERERRQRRKAAHEKTVPLGQVSNYADDGWEIVRRNKRTARVQKAKPEDQRLEDDVWTLLADMGFCEISQGRHFKIPVSGSTLGVPPKQIDVLAVDSDTAMVVECKASDTIRSRSLQKDLNETRGLQDGIRSTIHRHFEAHLRVCFVYVTRNIRWSSQDLGRAKDHQIAVIRDRQIDYYRRLTDIIQTAARHQFQADLLEGSSVRGLSATVPALRGKFGKNVFYQFAIEPDKLLKLAYVSHRSKVDSKVIGTYQRLLRKKRLKDISNYINETGGIFPTNIVINIRDSRRLRFDAAGPSSDAPTVLGTLYLPNTYKCAWVIDGQHRLYGFSQSEWSSRGRIPVLAFENLDPLDEMKMFVDINSKQVRVPRSLLVELGPELPASNVGPEQELKNLHAQLAIDISESDNSPLWDRVRTEWDTDTENKPITLPQLESAIKGSRLIGSIRSGALYPEFLYRSDTETTRERAKLTIEGFLSLFAEGAEEHWNLKPSAGGFLCTNLGIAALLRLFYAALEDKKKQEDHIEFEKLSPDALVGTVTDLVTPVIGWFSNPEANTDRFRGHYGSGAAPAYAFALMEIVNSRYADFNPPGLQDYVQEHSTETIGRARELITFIEDSIRDVTFEVLKSKYGDDDNSWWREGVPQSVRGTAAQRAEMSEEVGERHQFLDLLDYKKIAEQSKNWRDFESKWTIDGDARTKNDKLAWMDRLNRIRNRLFHSGRRHITNEEVVFLENVWVHVEEQLEALQK